MKPVYSFWLWNQGESFGYEGFIEIAELFLLADIEKMAKEIIELFRFLQGSFKINQLLFDLVW